MEKQTKLNEINNSATKNLVFADLGLSDSVLKAVMKKGFVTPSPIQAGVIPLLLNGDKDIIGQAQTGTGKTAAFALPLLEMIDPDEKAIQSIVMAPTRELAIQVAEEIKSFSLEQNITVQTIYGGNPMGVEISGIKRKPHIIVGTPGRIQHHIRTKTLKLNTVKYFVLDEADEMLNFGFRSEIESILALTSPERRVLLFSATMPKSILDIAKTYMGEYDSVKVAAKEMTNENITQQYFCLDRRDKIEALSQIMAVQEHFYAIVFCRTKANTETVAAQLRAKHLQVEAIHGDIDQKNRQKILTRFKAGQTKILVATDVAARGIDISELNFVINFSLPENHEIYTHRIGRTGRAGNKGTAISFVQPDELYKLRHFEKHLQTKLEKGSLPKPDQIIASKKNQLVEKLEHMINNEDLGDVRVVAKALLEEGDAESVIAALLKNTYQNDFDETSYNEIKEATRQPYSSRSRSGGRSGGSSYRGNRSGGHSGARRKPSAEQRGFSNKKRFKSGGKKKTFSKPKS